MSDYRKFVMGLMATASLSVITIEGSAQDGVGNAAAEDDILLEEIIVTAGRRSQSLKDVPAAVTAIQPMDYKTRGMQELKDVMAYVPGIDFNSGGAPGIGSITARGIPQSASTPVFGVYLDDTPLSSNTSFANGGNVTFDAMLMDIERIEVIKGPQGTLYGATSVGGMMRYISRDPALDEFRASFGVDISMVDGGGMGRTVNSRISLPVIEDKLGITLSGFDRKNPGYVDQIDPVSGSVIGDEIDESDTHGYAMDVLYQPTDRFDIRLKYMKQKSDYFATSGVALAGINTDDAFVGRYTALDGANPSSFSFEVMSGTINYDFDSVSLTSTTSVTEYNNTTQIDRTAVGALLTDFLSGRPFGTTTAVLFDAEVASEKLVQEIRLTSKDSDHFEWIAGLYYTEEDTLNDQYAYAVPAFDLLKAVFPSRYKEFAGFGDVTYYVNDRFDITAGVRLSKTKLDVRVDTEGPLIGTSSFESDEIKDTVDTYLFAAKYRIIDNATLYGRVASGYRPAFANIPVLDPLGQNISPPVVDSDTAWSYEIGLKGTTADKKLDYDLAFWMIDWSNFQTRIYSNTVSTLTNAADGLSAHGMEMSATYRATNNFTLIGNVSYAKSTLNADEPGFGGVADEQYPGLPNWKASLQWNYTGQVGDDWTANFGGGLRYIDGAVSGFSQNTDVLAVEYGSAFLTDVNLALTNGDVSFVLYATNLFNSRALLGRSDLFVASTGTVTSTGSFERPRTVGLNFQIDF